MRKFVGSLLGTAPDFPIAIYVVLQAGRPDILVPPYSLIPAHPWCRLLWRLWADLLTLECWR